MKNKLIQKKTKDKAENARTASAGHPSAGSLEDNRLSSVTQRKLADAITEKQAGAPIQAKSNATGLPDQLKSGIENLSGHSMDDVKVHYNSSQPAQLNAHAYAQGTNIHVAPGQEKHLAHEAWHVVQQKQGRVQPTAQLKQNVNINDNPSLEKEADVMGTKATQLKSITAIGNLHSSSPANSPVQRIVIPAVHESEKDEDTDKIDFPAFIRQLVAEGNTARLFYITRYIAAHADGKEKAHLLQVISEEAGQALPGEKKAEVLSKVEAIKKILSPHEMQILTGFLQRNTQERTQEILALEHPQEIHALIAKWRKEEEQKKALPVDKNWGDTFQLVRPLINLINSILKHGILSPEEAGRRGLRTVGSMDKGLINGISVNTFALTSDDFFKAYDLASKSMGMKDRGSVSVSLERTDDPLTRYFPDWKTMELDEADMKKVAGLPPEYQDSMKNILKKQKAADELEHLLNGPLKRFIDTRARGTIMALLDKVTTGISSTNVDKHSGLPNQDSSQEVRMDRSQIKPGHILELLVPDFIRPYFDHIVNPADIPIRFVESRAVDAHYKTHDGQVEIREVIAPSYVMPIAEKLTEERVLSTHIITTNPEE